MSDDPKDPRGAILVIDDDPCLRSTLARLLEEEGHRVLQAEDGPSALALARAHRCDLLLLEWATPGVRGDAALRHLRAALADATPPALLMTGAGVDARAAPPGAVSGIEKPFNVPELLGAVRRFLDHVDREAS